MAKKLFFTAAILFFAYWVSAQRFEGGFLAGFNATQVEGDNFKGYNKPGILGGFFVQTDIAPAIFAGMEIKYSQKGSRKRIKKNDPDPQKYIMRLGYVDVPLFVGFRTNDRGAVVAGVSAGYLIHSAEYDEYGMFPPEDQHAFNNLDLQPFLGFQFDMLDQLKLDLRFALSVLPVRGQPGDEATNYYWLNNQFNNVISLAAYYSFGR
ncbi:Outer membrane protein beta-barrel domain-containing protein [Mariniphaga anaerophila]|uniref:Outer membrane protein beta-barrel domain-containing protein n=1 Tax=Mariniphaga anaerophila TaxID=1484053 RepID=A0A1M4YWT5_9BACT|nr:porin family protein [Mariniphaga anaerophila]SHF10168.1 Outer membrane protein beta-barrel domain-containing protein [Mariniphaga anaerophila]